MCPESSKYEIDLWPDDNVDDQTIIVNVTILLARTVYMSYHKLLLENESVSLVGAQNRAGAAILAGLKEGIR